MSAFRIRSAGGYDQRGSAEIAVGQARVVLTSWGPAAADTVGVFYCSERKPRRCWTAVTPRTVREALSFAEALNSREPPGPAQARVVHEAIVGISPECVEDDSGACVHPLHDHHGGGRFGSPYDGR